MKIKTTAALLVALAVLLVGVGGALAGNTDLTSPGTGENDGNWTNPSYAEADDALYATALNGQAHQYFGYYFDSIPDGAAIEGIEVQLHAWVTAAYTASIAVELYDGSSWASEEYNTGALTTGPPEGTYTLGGPTGDWGGDWTVSEVKNNFIIKVTASTSTTPNVPVALDWIPVTVYYNAPPTVGDQTFSVGEDAENATVVGTVAADDPDTGDTLTYAITAGNDAGVFAIGSGTGALSVADKDSLDYETTTDYSLTIQVTDNGTGTLSDTATITVNVTDVNEAPVAVDDTGTVAEGSELNVAAPGLLANDTDPDSGDTLTVNTTAVSGPSNGSLTLYDDGSYEYAHDGSETTSDSFTYKANDGALNSNTATVNLTVTPVNDAPVASGIPAQTIDEGGTFTTIDLDVCVSDVDNTDAEMIWTYSGNTDLLVDITDRVATITIPNADWYGSETITFKATDPGGLFAEDPATFTVTAVNDAPVVSGIPDQTITEGDAFTTIALDAYVSDVDNTDAEMTWTYSGNSKLTVTIDGNRVVTIGIPHTDWYGSETITFRATDPDGLFDEDSATFTVGSANDPPMANDDSDTTPEDTPVTTNVAANDTDIDGTVVASTVAIVSGPSNGSVVSNGNGTATYMPNADFNGSDTYTYTLRDDNGAPSNVATVTIAVGPVNDTPIANDDTVLTDENTSISIKVTLNDGDLDGTINPATIIVDHAPVSGTVQVAGDGTITYSPNALFSGIDQFTYTVQDNEGATSNAAMVVITVVEVNDPPIAEDDLATTKSGAPVDIAVLTNDSDPDDNLVPGTVATLSEPESGTATVNWDGTITYTSVEGFVGTDQFTYRVQDVHDATSNEATVTVEVLEVTGEGGNELPVQAPMPSVGFLKHDTDDISWLVLSEPEENEGSYYILTMDSTVLEELALSADIQPTETRAGARIEVGLDLSEEDRKLRGWPWIRVTQPNLAESDGGGEAEIASGYSFSGRCANGLYWLGIDTGDLPPGRYNFWIVYGEGKALLVPILILP